MIYSKKNFFVREQIFSNFNEKVRFYFTLDVLQHLAINHGRDLCDCEEKKKDNKRHLII
jgi:hypothetical protein